MGRVTWSLVVLWNRRRPGCLPASAGVCVMRGSEWMRLNWKRPGQVFPVVSTPTQAIFRLFFRRFFVGGRVEDVMHGERGWITGESGGLGRDRPHRLDLGLNWD